MEVKQCGWKCPVCGRQCGGWEGHRGEHQCPEHYPIVKALREITETTGNILKIYGYEEG